jgi:peptidoglycan/xylan/chitin deacetylase (PgdA/CDA1 family)
MRPFRHWPLPGRPKLELPNGARLAVWVAPNIEVYEAGKSPISIGAHTARFDPDPMNDGWRDYGARVGVWRLMEVLERHGFRGSAPINAEACEAYPEIVEAGNERGWCWIAHGKENTTLHGDMEPGVERPLLLEMHETIERLTGRPSRGWLGPGLTETAETPGILAELGYTYLTDWCNDDQPFPLDVSGARMIAVPYSIEVNDIPVFIGGHASAPVYEQMLVDQFEMLHAAAVAADTAYVMAIPVHPFLVGLPFRLRHLERALAHIASHDDVWLTTSDEIADWYLENHYDAALESIGGLAGSSG